MKMIQFLFLIGLSITLVQCNVLDEKFTQFDLDYKTSFKIENSSGLNLPFDVFTPDVTTNSEAEFSLNDTRTDLVEEVLLKKLDLKITAPEVQDFSFLKSVQVFLSAEGLSELEVAKKTTVPDDIGDFLELEVTENDLSKYIIKDKFSIRVEATTDEFITNDIYIDIASIFGVDAKLIP